MKISNVKVYGLNESMYASGYPMKIDILEEMKVIPSEFYEKDIKRAKTLGNAKPGSGHDNYLKGIIVQFDLQAPEYFWRQFDRYHFHDYISSQSKMHCITKMDVDKMCNKYVDQRVINVVNEYIDMYNNYETLKVNPVVYTKNHLFQKILSNCPMGFELTARITSNYLQEKSIHFQRRNHKLEEWQYYCDWHETLPMFTELCLRKGEDE
jgi:hypothetical protein